MFLKRLSVDVQLMQIRVHQAFARAVWPVPRLFQAAASARKQVSKKAIKVSDNDEGHFAGTAVESRKERLERRVLSSDDCRS